ncbi:hypothetical protein AVI53_05405 [Piscirickettsia salmonis]|uniref:hypothetical protein n=1 Tax=Piscirickettsia salmonis TaxID=1238 RepID=UPI00066249C1|nr:hypothetical protein [Piscirickettsia salmonis]ALT18587.1 hypothetical protein PSLF89_06975 [Piscirickettsia salmonis LF-89 = ATCC VR-1361]ALY03327.1 hypothetical protein AWE47_11120 [Piscirickettsia salmonis]AMA42893.1 hypothetical protein AWJ11_11350 [Piscirickettsia salmonis]AOS35361.1 hypothetical protein AVM72_08475 [Piscirickettsia salmonis]APS60066.1 hypothetical protein AVI53_05405 [Piscirickettsia salmonis]
MARSVGANPNSPYDTLIDSFRKPSPFQTTIKDKNQAMISLLLQYGANPHDQIDADLYIIFRSDYSLLKYAT